MAILNAPMNYYSLISFLAPPIPTGVSVQPDFNNSELIGIFVQWNEVVNMLYVPYFCLSQH